MTCWLLIYVKHMVTYHLKHSNISIPGLYLTEKKKKKKKKYIYIYIYKDFNFFQKKMKQVLYFG